VQVGNCNFFDIYGANDSLDIAGIEITSSAGPVIVSNCRMDNFEQQSDVKSVYGILCEADGCTLTNNIITDIDNTGTTPANAFGMSVSGDNCTLSANIISAGSGKGIEIKSGATNAIVQGCISSDNGADSGIDNTNEDNFSDAGTNTFAG